jgi:hypothetical protein
MSNDKRENEDEAGILYDLHDKLREVFTQYNDTIKGRCAVCLEHFGKEDGEEVEESFTDRVDLVRIDECFHRFHLICVHRDWFMQRVPEKDQFGGLVEYSVPEIKKCPICRRVVEEEEISYISNQFS